MKLKPILLAALVSSGLNAGAQAWVQDSVVTGPGYVNDVSYSMHSGTVASNSNSNWHLAFQMIPNYGPDATAAVYANHVMGKVNVFSLHKRASTNFTTIAAADTVGMTAATSALYNSDTTWNYGAFNKNHNVADPFDYGWGYYSQTTHILSGDSVYLVKVDTVPYKLWIKQYVSYPADSAYWTFRIAKLDGTNDTTVTMYRHISTPDFANRVYGYYNISTKTIVDREPARSSWDLLFTRYLDSASQGPTFIPYYPASGVFSNVSTSVAEVHGINPDSVLSTSVSNYSAIKNVIGYDWKHFAPPAGPWAVDSTVFFVKSTNTNEYYQLQFTGFGGSANGIYHFRKRLLGTTSVSNITSTLNSYAFAPNPAQNETSIMIDAKEAVGTAQVLVSDITGKMISRIPVDIKKGMNGFSLNTSSMAGGLYVITITNGSWKVAGKLIVQH
ncbi:T9SS type A sorting domain-containing protein [Chitinophagaceae bacterium MMS25-I14]